MAKLTLSYPNAAAVTEHVLEIVPETRSLQWRSWRAVKRHHVRIRHWRQCDWLIYTLFAVLRLAVAFKPQKVIKESVYVSAMLFMDVACYLSMLCAYCASLRLGESIDVDTHRWMAAV